MTIIKDKYIFANKIMHTFEIEIKIVKNFLKIKPLYWFIRICQKWFFQTDFYVQGHRAQYTNILSKMYYNFITRLKFWSFLYPLLKLTERFEKRQVWREKGLKIKRFEERGVCREKCLKREMFKERKVWRARVSKRERFENLKKVTNCLNRRRFEVIETIKGLKKGRFERFTVWKV